MALINNDELAKKQPKERSAEDKARVEAMKARIANEEAEAEEYREEADEHPGDSNSRTHESTEEPERPSLEEIEKESIRRALERNNGSRKQAAQDLLISERTLYRKIEKYGL